jgi:hypothetical protein
MSIQSKPSNNTTTATTTTTTQNWKQCMQQSNSCLLPGAKSIQSKSRQGFRFFNSPESLKADAVSVHCRREQDYAFISAERQ